MATKKSTTNENKSMVRWDEELAKQAEVAAAMENSTATGQFFSMRGGQLTFNDAPMPGNRVLVVVLDTLLENIFYTGKFNPEEPSGPACFAFGRDDKDMAPHELAQDKQSEKCMDCPNNQWGTADTGRGKACRNTRRLALIPAGSFNARGEAEVVEDAEHYNTAALAFMKLPVTSVKGYAAFVKSLAGTLKRPPHGVFTRISVVPDPKTQFKVVFDPVKSIPNALMATIMDRVKEAKSVIDFPYQPVDDAAPARKTSHAPARAPRGSTQKPAKKSGRKF